MKKNLNNKIAKDTFIEIDNLLSDRQHQIGFVIMVFMLVILIITI